MKKLILAFGLLVALLAPMQLAVSTVSAIDTVPACSDPKLAGTDICPAVKQGESGPSPIVGTIKAAINVVSYIVGVAAVISLIVSGMRMALANGDANAVNNARSGIIYALVGIVIVVVSQSIVVLVLNKIK